MPHSAHHKHLQSKFSKSFLGKLVLIMAIVEPLMSLPQAFNIWIHHQTAGVSFATWSFFTGAAVIWLLYGIQIKNKPLIVSSTLWFLIEASIVVGLLIY